MRVLCAKHRVASSFPYSRDGRQGKCPPKRIPTKEGQGHGKPHSFFPCLAPHQGAPPPRLLGGGIFIILFPRLGSQARGSKQQDHRSPPPLPSSSLVPAGRSPRSEPSLKTQANLASGLVFRKRPKKILLLSESILWVISPWG